MKQITGTFKKSEDKKHSVIVKPIGDNPLATAVYVMRLALLAAGVSSFTDCKITVSFPEGGQDEAYNNIK